MQTGCKRGVICILGSSKSSLGSTFLCYCSTIRGDGVSIIFITA